LAKAGRIEDVSDTALWVAVYRARESKKPNALFSDPYASILAGEKGEKIAKRIPFASVVEWILVIRTVAIDRLVLKSLQCGVDTVLNLGAGLDTRPYRLDLPANLRWIEVDFPQIIELKEKRLSHEQAKCRLERVALDLSNHSKRQSFFKKISSESKCVLVITEGVLLYLTNEEVASFAQDLLVAPHFQYWIQDYRMGGYGKWLPKPLKMYFKDAPFQFAPKNWFKFFEELGWVPKEVLTTYDEARRVQRPMPMKFLFGVLQFMQKSAGYVLFQKR
jgi:methyltransferase (TIGR00027 family)